MIKIKLKNVDKTFEELIYKRKQELEKFNKEQSDKLLLELRAVTPVDTGLARDSWSSSKTIDGYNIKNSTEYIQYLNEGTSQQAPAHFIELTAIKYGKPSGTIVQVIDK